MSSISLDVGFSQVAEALGDGAPLLSVTPETLLAIAFSSSESSRLLKITPMEFVGEWESAIDDRAAAKLLHVARQRTDTSRWWTMRWPVGAISLLSRAGRLDATKTYELMRKLRQLSNNFMRELWEAAVERRREVGSAALRESTREDWMKQKRRLGAIGRERKGKLMPSWESVRRLPLHRIRHQLARWTRVSLRTVIRGGQRTLNGYVIRARGATKRPANGDDDGSVAANSKQRREDAPLERPQRQPALHDAHKRAAAAATASPAAAPADGLTATAATAPQAAGAKRGSDTQAAALHRPATSARITANSPTPAPLAAASARQKRRHSGVASQDQSNGSTASQPKRRRAPVAPATQSIERFLTPLASTAAPPNPPQDHPAPPHPHPSLRQISHKTPTAAERCLTPQIPSTCDSLMAGRRFSFGFWCWWALANLARCGRVYV